MQECSKCGSTVMLGYKFCKSCGTQINVEETNSEPHQVANNTVGETPDPSNPAFVQEAANQVKDLPSHPVQTGAVATASSESKSVRSSRSGKWRIRIILATSLLIVAVLLVGGYRFGSYWTSDERLISQFEKAIQTQDYKEVAVMFESDEEKLVINEQTVKGYVDYLKENKEITSDIIKDLRKQAFTLVSGGETESASSREVLLQQKGKTAFIFNTYKLQIMPVHIHVTTNYKDTMIRINGEDKGVATEPDFDQTFGPYFPGTFDLEAVLHTDWIELARKETVTVISGSQDYNANMELDGTEVTIDTGYYDTTGLKGELLVNGKATGMNPFETPELGPIPTDGTVSLAIELQLPWGTLRSREVSVESSFVSINIENIQDAAFKDQLIEQIVQFNREELEAVTTGNMAVLSAVTDNILDYERTVANRISQDSIPQQLTYMSATFDLESFVIYPSDGVWRVSVKTKGSYNYKYKSGAEWGEDVEESEGRYHSLLFDENKKLWLMDSVSTFYDGEAFSDNLKEVVEQNTVAHETTIQSLAKRADLPSLQTFLYDYLTLSVQAINSRDFSRVSVAMDPAGPAYGQSENYIPYLEGKGITEELLDIESISFRVLDDTSVEVTAHETFNIINKDGIRKERSYASTYKLFDHNGEWKVHTLVETKEI